jgi:predicted metal-dependent hydrolase
MNIFRKQTVTKSEIRIMDQLFQLKITRRNFQKNINLRIRTPGEILISCSKLAPNYLIKKLLSGHQEWLIQTNQKLLDQKAQKTISYQNGAMFLFNGEKFPLKIDYQPQKKSLINFQNNQFVVRLCYDLNSEQQHRQLKAIFNKFYRQQTIERCQQQLAELQKNNFQKINKIRIKKSLKSRWGSCSRQKNLNFSQELSKLPQPVQDYIIIHEYAHLFHFDHSKKFWLTVEQFDPDYKNHRKWLKQNQKSFG